MWHALYIVLMLILSGIASAGDNDTVERTNLLFLAPEKIEQYANSIGCVYKLGPLVEYQIPKKGQYVLAVISLDSGCSGGNKMVSQFFVAVKRGGFDPAFVDPELSLSSMTRNFPNNITNLWVHENELWFDAKPEFLGVTNYFTGRVVFENGKWQPNYEKSPPNEKQHKIEPDGSLSW